MTLEEMKILFKQGKLKCSDLDAEDFLKYHKCELAEVFEITNDEVVKIRRKVLPSMYYENNIRQILVMLDYIDKNNYNFTKEEKFNLIVACFEGSIMSESEVHQNAYRKRFKQIDWFNMDIAEEIKKRKIDLDYRHEEMSRLFEMIDGIYQSREFEREKEVHNYVSYEDTIPREKSNKHTSSTTSYQRNSSIAEYVLKMHDYKCELNPNHETFIRRSNYTKYMEPHHLIPLGNQDSFEYSLDVPANIICLCPTCHREIHYGVRYRIDK